MTEFLLSKKNTWLKLNNNKTFFSCGSHAKNLLSLKTINGKDSSSKMQRPISYRSRIKTSMLNKKEMPDEDSALQQSL
jgi:hypothetical protein